MKSNPIRSGETQFTGYQADVTDADAVSDVVERFNSEAGSLEVAIGAGMRRDATFVNVIVTLPRSFFTFLCNPRVPQAGITGATAINTHEVDLDDFARVMAVNVGGILHLNQAALRVMLPNRYGRLVNIASISGKEGNAGMVRLAGGLV